MPPRGIVCSMCGKEFFERSLPIHQKTCAKKQRLIVIECQHCGKEVPKLDLAKHLARCSKARKVQHQQRGSQALADPGALGTAFDSSGRLQCAICSRWFAADRVAKHQAICSKVTYKKRAVFDSFKQRQFDPLVQKAAPVARGAAEGLAAARSYYATQPQQQQEAVKAPYSLKPAPSNSSSSRRFAPRKPINLRQDEKGFSGPRRVSQTQLQPPSCLAPAAGGAAAAGSHSPSRAPHAASSSRALNRTGEQLRDLTGSRWPPASRPVNPGAVSAFDSSNANRLAAPSGSRGPVGPISTSNESSADNPLAYPNYPY